MHLAFGPEVTRLSTEDGGAVALGPSPAALAAACFGHDPPTARELEQAIDVVEDALMAARPPLADGHELTTLEPVLRQLPGLATWGSTLSRDAIEGMFQLLASMASGLPTPGAAVIASREVAAAVLITRECMHHLGFEIIRIGRATAA
jgi:hypothetical protein